MHRSVDELMSACWSKHFVHAVCSHILRDRQRTSLHKQHVKMQPDDSSSSST